MSFWRIKWENIFGIITGISLLSMIIKYVILYGFDLNIIGFELIFSIIFISGIMWCVKMTRKFYLN